MANANPNTLLKMGTMHVAILDYLMANPMATKRELAVQFGVSPNWMSIVIRSHAFQEMLAKRQEQFFGAAVVPIREKMLGIVDQALDKVADGIEVMQTAEALETADTLLHRLGFAPAKSGPTIAPGQVVQNNNYFVSSEVLQSARARFGQPTQEITDGEIIEQSEVQNLPAA